MSVSNISPICRYLNCYRSCKINLIPVRSAIDPNCGVSKYPDSGIDQGDESFIIGGWDAREHEFPWMVIVMFIIYNSNFG